MSIGEIVGLLRGGILETVILAAPILLSALIVGLLVAVFQAVSSIQEQTLTLVPKVFVILLVLFLLGGWMFTSLGEYTVNLFRTIPDMR
ncbi:flagellar biosynthesis protein FliQ [Leadbettera azotonutricia]|uniref:Flagellar biosynthetic protein FliQ n=1 Tax=Leadbettera azotonutricia (strain ATCC BAA-888 / DSM 13862 / ZAS-9) TaxID=545695 RepID=F5YEV1_LEAAZ|nr:flagellar biosynthesis protein FliQ [Leadbettera azotonutricia]AEF82250.1 flagellar biosynthetic protein FliQ [Leadbettera azotonutricia ZAS-9]